ncbi:hypothetical protein [Micromonospora chokoriensis]|uniref:hypothetical protein n=1 Tax=Micromonospora chokoriensis TaxID=356851 RepID=UPI0004C3A5EC|nr:hypothetical protein [Micromonospora chokoriensis]
MSPLERRYRWLLRAYPRPYREYRTDEILEIVLARTDEQQRPSLPESAALVAAGLRVRTGVDRLDTQALRRSALRLSALALLILGVALHSGVLIYGLIAVAARDWYNAPTWESATIAPVLTIGLTAAAWGKYRVAFGAVSTALAGQYWLMNPSGPVLSVDAIWPAMDVRFLSPLLASLALLPLLRAPRASVAKPWIWLILGSLAVFVLAPNPLTGGHPAPVLMSLYVFAALAIVAAPIDPRMPIVAFALILPSALALTVAHLLKATALSETLYAPLSTTLILAAIMAATLTASTLTSRRHLRI